MSKEKYFISIRDLLDKQVIDNKGSLLGVIKDLKLLIGGQEAETFVELKSGEEVKIPWSDVQSVEDFVLLKKVEKKLSKVKEPARAPKEPAQTPSVPSPILVCTGCGAKAPRHAKFCPRCGKTM